MTIAAAASRSREELIARAGESESIGDLFGRVSDRLRRLVPFDASVWLATDPATGLPTAPTRAENMEHIGGPETCMRLWELEFLVQDVNLYRDLARADTPAAGLRAATEDRPARSPRYRDSMRPNGLGDELRAVMRVDGAPWALVTLFRQDGEPAFGGEEAELVASLSCPLAEAVRQHARPRESRSSGGVDHGPGVMLFDPAGELTSINDDALAWLDELALDVEGAQVQGVRLPIVVLSTLVRARAIAEERDHGIARARVRSSASGRWLVCHASCLRDPDGAIGNTALVIEPAKASEIAPIVAQAYELSPREQQITELIARGLATADIAERLFLSVHTVRDYVKAIFDKVGVSSRGELVAKLFAEHYAPVHLDPDGADRSLRP
jgi:DNA-binding CsgD family transcriptional regulator